MKKRTKETILEAVAILSFIVLLVFTAMCEQGKFTLAQYIAHGFGALVVLAVSVITLRVMEASTNE